MICCDATRSTIERSIREGAVGPPCRRTALVDSALGVRRVAFVGNALPRRCGIATFTAHIEEAVSNARPGIETVIVAMNDRGGPYDYPDTVGFTIDDQVAEDYLRAAEFINRNGFDVVSLQHEYGIFGGDAGCLILDLLGRLTVPVVTTLHTVLAEPNDSQRRVLKAVVGASAKVVVMAEMGRQLLIDVFGIAPDKIEVIPHGIPDFAFVEPEDAKNRLELGQGPVILTFGLLAPNKGIETMIDAMPQILAASPQARYLVLGTTHPNLLRHEGEAYRDRLTQRATDRGVAAHVELRDAFVDQDLLLDYISACDVYVTPYLNEAQMTSGTLSYSFGLGKAVVSTPYWHASELLADGHGVLVPFADPSAMGREIARLLVDDGARDALRRRAYGRSRDMVWSSVAARYLAAFDAARPRQSLRIVAPAAATAILPKRQRPDVQLAAFLSMCDDTGLFQHAVHSVPDRAHGYCVDDNARALILACQLNGAGEVPLDEIVATRFAAFIQHAWNPDLGRFRNFMGFDRRWLEPQGSEDSHGRTLWALGEASLSDASPSRRRWAATLFGEALRAVEAMTSPRTWAFTLLGLDRYLTAHPDDETAAATRSVLANRLGLLFHKTATSDWAWFEDGLSYDNARLPQALIVSGAAMGAETLVNAGLDALRWLVAVQTAPSGHFRPVGSESFGDLRAAPRPFDQQPLEATATISACLAALRVTSDTSWRTEAERAFDWFTGRNDLGVSLIDADTGSCRDGLHSDRPNDNRGAESLLAWLMSAAEMRALAAPREVRPLVASLVA